MQPGVAGRRPAEPPRLRTVHTYTVVHGRPKVPLFTRYAQNPEILPSSRLHFPRRKEGVPVPVWSKMWERHPTLVGSPDLTVVLNPDGHTVFGTAKVFEKANEGLATGGARVRWRVISQNTLTLPLEDGTSRTLIQAVPEFLFDGPPPETCIDLTAAILGGAPTHALFRGPFNREATARLVDKIPTEDFPGFQHLASKIAQATTAFPYDASTSQSALWKTYSPEWSAEELHRGVGGSSTIRNSSEYGGRFNPTYLYARLQNPTLRAPRERLLYERLIRAAGEINEEAWPGLNEAFFSQSTYPEDLILGDGPQSVTVAVPGAYTAQQHYGYHVEAVVLLAEDGTRITLGNRNRRQMWETFDAFLEQYGDRLAEMRDEIPLTTRRSLARFRQLCGIALNFKENPTDGLREEAHELLYRLAQPSPSRVWYVAMYGKHPLDSYHQRVANLIRDPRRFAMVCNPVSVTVTTERWTARRAPLPAPTPADARRVPHRSHRQRREVPTGPLGMQP
jgi:hypothetical protein